MVKVINKKKKTLLEKGTNIVRTLQFVKFPISILKKFCSRIHYKLPFVGS